MCLLYQNERISLQAWEKAPVNRFTVISVLLEYEEDKSLFYL